MLVELALALAIRSSNPALSEAKAHVYASWVLQESTARSLDPWIFQAIIHRETRWSAGAVRHERNGSCSVGLGQINVPCRKQLIHSLLEPRANLYRVGEMLERLQRTCKHDCQDLGWLRGYNPGDAVYLAAIQEAVRNYDAQTTQPHLLSVSPRVHASWVPWKATHRAGRECWMDIGSSDPL